MRHTFTGIEVEKWTYSLTFIIYIYKEWVRFSEREREITSMNGGVAEREGKPWNQREREREKERTKRRNKWRGWATTEKWLENNKEITKIFVSFLGFVSRQPKIFWSIRTVICLLERKFIVYRCSNPNLPHYLICLFCLKTRRKTVFLKNSMKVGYYQEWHIELQNIMVSQNKTLSQSAPYFIPINASRIGAKVK